MTDIGKITAESRIAFLCSRQITRTAEYGDRAASVQKERSHTSRRVTGFVHILTDKAETVVFVLTVRIQCNDGYIGVKERLQGRFDTRIVERRDNNAAETLIGEMFQHRSLLTGIGEVNEEIFDFNIEAAQFTRRTVNTLTPFDERVNLKQYGGKTDFVLLMFERLADGIDFIMDIVNDFLYAAADFVTDTFTVMQDFIDSRTVYAGHSGDFFDRSHNEPFCAGESSYRKSTFIVSGSMIEINLNRKILMRSSGEECYADEIKMSVRFCTDIF